MLDIRDGPSVGLKIRWDGHIDSDIYTLIVKHQATSRGSFYKDVAVTNISIEGHCEFGTDDRIKN